MHGFPEEMVEDIQYMFLLKLHYLPFSSNLCHLFQA